MASFPAYYKLAWDVIDLMLVAFLLLFLAAAARTIWLRFRPSAAAHLAPKQSPRKSSAADALLLLGVAMAWYNVSSGWIAQLTIYPIYGDINAYGSQAFHGFSHGYLSRIPISIVLPAGVMCLAWALLLWLPCRNVPTRIVWSIIALCVAFVAVTFIAAGTQGQMYHEGFSNYLYARLLWSNGVRAIIFTLIGLLSLAAVRRRWMFNGSESLGRESP
jgi:hypothetical protein